MVDPCSGLTIERTYITPLSFCIVPWCKKQTKIWQAQTVQNSRQLLGKLFISLYWALTFHDAIISQAYCISRTNGTLQALYLPWVCGYPFTICAATYVSSFYHYIASFSCLSILCFVTLFPIQQLQYNCDMLMFVFLFARLILCFLFYS